MGRSNSVLVLKPLSRMRKYAQTEEPSLLLPDRSLRGAERPRDIILLASRVALQG